MQKPNIDDKLTLLTDFGETEAICTEVMDDPPTEDGCFTQSNGARPIHGRTAMLACRSRRLETWGNSRECFQAKNRQRR